ncbi:sugar transferase [Bythopirellula polymerisocia]|uniref:Putative undecaprenyl-phosphate N-acetylgalactosaminyl 1-phosphate transferase n=1 Tax=Bythopirellula polymerisocia TaxID=2528003 RepID=A0A5C6CMV6_9BACT|nr:sugar transferase [Bythopirellula polymerisocia]TWU24681.1 putative undecaprenyl-phosphate N-acetylgalactosaminyl 1-phosphate transferase [Bythopirellula polymerisocia]
MLTRQQQIVKRTFDVVLSAVGLVVCVLPIALAVLIARMETRRSGIFRQTRVGQRGRLFSVYKIRTMHDLAGITTHVTRKHDPRITRSGQLLRLTRIDELPQLFNVLKGDMSLVGPRPDVQEVAWRLKQEAPLVLTVRPGITGPASLKYREEEEILEMCADPEWVNEAILFPDKMRINTAYVQNYCWQLDLKFLWQTISGTGERASINDISKQIANRRRAA